MICFEGHCCLLKGRSLKCFDANDPTVCVGSIDIRNCTVADMLPVDCPGHPKATFPFRIKNDSKNLTDVFCAVTEVDRENWKSFVMAKVNFMKTTGEKMWYGGFLKKLDRSGKHWNRRYFVLDLGLLSYYDSEAAAKKDHKGIHAKKKLGLKDACVTKMVEDTTDGAMHRLRLKVGLLEPYILELEDAHVCTLWYNQLVSHIEFATSWPDMVEFDNPFDRHVPVAVTDTSTDVPIDNETDPLNGGLSIRSYSMKNERSTGRMSRLFSIKLF